MEAEQKGFETWGILELFGHQQIAGLVSEATIGGCSFIRVDVPETNGLAAFTKFYGNGAIYAMTPVEERVARMALERIRPRPISVYLLPAPQPGGEDRRGDDQDWEESPDDER